MNLLIMNAELDKSVINKLNERIIGGEGNFFRYVPVGILEGLSSGKIVEYDGRQEYKTVCSSFSTEVRPLNAICYYLSNILTEYFNLEISDEHELELLDIDDPQQLLEEKLVSIDGDSVLSLQKSITEAVRKRDLSAIVLWLRSEKGDELMVSLKRDGWGTYPAGSFSDLIPLSVGAPLLLPGNDETAILEMSFDKSDIVIPKTDFLNEHEVMVRRIGMNNIRKAYGQREVPELLERLSRKYPDYFKNGKSEDVLRFAREVKLDSLL